MDEITPRDARRIIDRAVDDHARAEVERDKLTHVRSLKEVRSILVEAGIPRRDVEKTLEAHRRKMAARRRARRRRPLIVGFFVVMAGAAAAYGATWVAPRYDTLVVQREEVRREWAQIDAVLQRRYDLIPNLVEVVGGFAGQEDNVLSTVSAAHAGYVRAKSPEERIHASYQAERAIRGCALLSMRYPELRSSEGFLRLMSELTETEDELLAQRMKYNDTVADLNAALQTVDGRVVSLVAGFELADYYNPPQETEALPQVAFEGSTASVAMKTPEAQPKAEPPSQAATAEPPKGIEAATLEGVAGRGRKRTATVRLPDGESRRLKLGDRLEDFDARVVAVNAKSVLLETSTASEAGNTITRTVRLNLPH